jgi:hypothetical protein
MEVGDLPGRKCQAIKQSPIYFDTTVSAKRAGKVTLTELLNKLFS